MAKKYYAVKAGRKPGVYETWDEAKAQVSGFSGAIYKGFPTKEEALSFVADEVGPRGERPSQGAALSGDKREDTLTRTAVIENLSRVAVQDKGNILLVGEELIPYRAMMQRAFEEACLHPVEVGALAENDAVQKLEARYGRRLKDGLCGEETHAIAFVDGGGDKGGADHASSRIPFGVIFMASGGEEPACYRYVFTRGGDYDWLFAASNVAGEEMAALFAMYLCEKRGESALRIYQDNNLPAKYFTGEFKRIHHSDDYALMLLVTESIRHLREGRDISFCYVPSEHSRRKSKAEKLAAYERQTGARLPFDEAQFFNGISDVLADYKH